MCEAPNPARDRRRDGRALPHDVTVKLSFMGRRGRAWTPEPEDLPDGSSTGNGVCCPVQEVRIARPTDDWQVELREVGRAPACALGFVYGLL